MRSNFRRGPQHRPTPPAPGRAIRQQRHAKDDHVHWLRGTASGIPPTAARRAVRTGQMSDPARLQPAQTSRRHPTGAPSPCTGPKSSSARNCTNVQVVAAIYRKKVASAWISALSVVFVRGQALKLWRGTFAMNRSRVLIIYAVRCSPCRLWPLGDLRRRSDVGGLLISPNMRLTSRRQTSTSRLISTANATKPIA